ncbi:MAG: hypothetical protein JO304_14195 [Solirubrobacterales bacterium]|nr:hypothetical protein [Solirubrobacterales bacterium]
MDRPHLTAAVTTRVLLFSRPHLQKLPLDPLGADRGTFRISHMPDMPRSRPRLSTGRFCMLTWCPAAWAGRAGVCPAGGAGDTPGRPRRRYPRPAASASPRAGRAGVMQKRASRNPRLGGARFCISPVQNRARRRVNG